MGLMGFLFKFTFQCFRIIAWPLLALGDHIVHPIISVNLNVFFNWFVEMFSLMSKEDNYLVTQANREANEPEPQDLQNPISFKGMVERPEVEQKDILVEEIKEKELSGLDPVTQTELGLADEVDRVKPKEQPLEGKVLLENSAQAAAETTDSEAIQKVWTCVLCKAKCRSKFVLADHFQGKRHARALENLKERYGKFYFKTWTCELCNVQVQRNNKSNLIAHFESSRHLFACENT